MPFFLSQEPSLKTTQIWLLLHGYAQLPEYFIKHFELFFNDKNVFIAPQAMSTLYIHGTSGRVGASWMTKHNRLNDIDDTNAYLNALILDVKSQCSNDVQFNVLAFSQGCAVALRWFYQSNCVLNKMIIWGGTLPHDLPLDVQKEKLKEVDLHIVNGKDDPYLKEEVNLQEIRKVIDDAGIFYQWHMFDGGHHLDADTLQNLIGF